MSLFSRLLELRRLYIGHPNGLTDKEVMGLTGLSYTTLQRCRKQLGAYRVQPGYWTVDPTPEDAAFVAAYNARVQAKTIQDYHREGWYLNVAES